MLRANSQRVPDDVHVVADVQALDVHSPRGGREEASQDRANK